MSEQQHGRDAFVHALLQEELGSEPRPASAAELVQRLQRGDGMRAFARTREAEPERRRAWLARRWPLVAAALAMLAVAATFARDWLPGGSRWTFTDLTHATNPEQDPRPKQDDAVRIRDLEHFRKLVPQIRGVFVEPLWLHDANLPFEVEVKGYPAGMLPHSREPFVAALGNDLKRLDPAGADWQNKLTFELQDGRSIEGAIYPYSGAGVLRVHLRGLKGDLGVGGMAGDMLRDLLDSSVLQACYHLGIVTKDLPLKQTQRDRTSLRLFQTSDAQLKQLEEFDKLTKLDVSGLRNTLGADGLRTIAKACPQLEELVLDRVELPDDALIRLVDLTKVKRLSLRGVRGFTGTGFRYYTLSQRHRDGPTEVDLSYCKSLTDDGLEAICEWDPEVLRLRGAGTKITAAGFRALTRTTRLRELDLRTFAMNDKRMVSTLSELRAREGLTLVR